MGRKPLTDETADTEPASAPADSKLSVRPIDAAQHLEFIRTRPAASFLQTPAWAAVKTGWRSESLGWFDATGDLVGAGLVLYRQLPKLRRYLAYLPEGPIIDWSAADIGDWLIPMAQHLKSAGAFGIRIGCPVVVRRWRAPTIKAAIADDRVGQLSQALPDFTSHDATRLRLRLRELGWRPPAEDSGFSAGQPRFVFQLPIGGKRAADLLTGMNQLWRRNIKRAAKLGVEVTEATAAELPEFHRIYVETAQRDGFSPRSLEYFQHMFEVLNAEEPQRIRLYLAHYADALVAGATAVRVGQHVWYTYGASTTAHREVRGSNAVQWRIMTDALAAGATIYDLRGITEGLEADDPHLGLIQFKVGTGGEAVEYVGEWDLPLNHLLYAAFDAYLRHR